MKELNYELLKELYCIHSMSRREKKMRRFLKKWIGANVPEAKVVQDNTGNLYITKGEAESYPCLCAHMDQVQDFHPKDFMCVESDEVIFGYSPKTRRQCGLGADDKNGLFLALSCLQRYGVLKCAFFVGEEIGCVGSSMADTEFFKDCRFCVQIDRRGNSDMVTEISEMLCSEDFINAADCGSWGYEVSDGLMTDVEALREKGVEVSCINLSCGYYEPHTDMEFTFKPDLEKCYAFVCHLIEDCTATYPYKYKPCLLETGGRFSLLYDYDDLYDIVDNALADNPDMTFGEYWETHGVSYTSLYSMDVQQEVFDEMKKYYSFGD